MTWLTGLNGRVYSQTSLTTPAEECKANWTDWPEIETTTHTPLQSDQSNSKRRLRLKVAHTSRATIVIWPSIPTSLDVLLMYVHYSFTFTFTESFSCLGNKISFILCISPLSHLSPQAKAQRLPLTNVHLDSITDSLFNKQSQFHHCKSRLRFETEALLCLSLAT